MIIATSRWLPLVLVAGLTGCQTATPIADVPSPSPMPSPTPMARPTPPDIRWVPGLPEALEPNTVPFETVVFTDQGYHNDTPSSPSKDYVNEQAVFNSQAELDAFLKRRPRAVPPIDFTTKTAIAMVSNGEPTTGNTMEMMRIQEQPDRLIVHTVRWLPDMGAVGLPMVGVPFHLVTIPKTDKRIDFMPVVSALGDMYPAGRQPPSRTPGLQP